MGNYKRVKLYIGSEGYMYITSEEDLNNWEEVVTDENIHTLKKVEVIEEYDLPPHLFNYITSDELDEKLEEEMEKFICNERIRISREKKITKLLD